MQVRTSYGCIAHETLGTLSDRDKFKVPSNFVRIPFVLTLRALPHLTEILSPNFRGGQSILYGTSHTEYSVADHQSAACAYTVWSCIHKAFEYYRMSIQSFDLLLNLTKDYITKQNIKLRIAIPPEERLTVTLRYLSTFISRFLDGTIDYCRNNKRHYEVVWKVLQPLEMPEPNKESWLKVAEEFYKYANFPNCLGTVDAAYSNYCFISIDVGSFGKEADSNVFRSSNFGQKLYHDMTDLPEDKILSGTIVPTLPFVLVADEAFALHKNVMRPYPNKTLDIEKRTFNYRLSRARRYVECTFGILSNKWRVLHTAILVNPDFATEIVKTTCVLHNFVRRRDGLNYNDELLTSDLPTLTNCNTSRPSNAINTRDLFKKYFMEEGKLEWQHNFI
nr:uncharacterized protein LOC113393302 [Vanessa tameamea]